MNIGGVTGKTVGRSDSQRNEMEGADVGRDGVREEGEMTH